MLFNYPSFIGEKEQTESELLFNSVKILLQTSLKEIWVDLDFGTNIREKIKSGIDDLLIFDIKNEIEQKINKYFYNNLNIDVLDVIQDTNNNVFNRININLKYTELKTGKQYTIKTVSVIENN